MPKALRLNWTPPSIARLFRPKPSWWIANFQFAWWIIPWNWKFFHRLKYLSYGFYSPGLGVRTNTRVVLFALKIGLGLRSSLFSEILHCSSMKDCGSFCSKLFADWSIDFLRTKELSLHLDHSVRHHRYHRWSIRSRYSARSEVAIVRCNYFRQSSVAATFAVDATVAAGVDFELAEADGSSAAALGAFVDSD